MIVDGDEKRPLLLQIALGLVNNVSYAAQTIHCYVN